MLHKRLDNLYRVLLMLGVAATLAACGPENGRPLGGGSGADVENVASDFSPRSKVFQPGGGETRP